jgi:exopolysaccharide biosynthesis polyprenyl glycosylphosphotransferase
MNASTILHERASRHGALTISLSARTPPLWHLARWKALLSQSGRTLLTRMFDLAVGSAMLLLAAPLMALAVLAVCAEGGGPVLYRQTRTGLGGAPFQMLKFRSMRLNAEPDGIPRWAAEDDPRVTRIGRFMRRTKIDELPQLVNVLKGEMSLIGPRPERPMLVQTLSRSIPFYTLRHTVKPGITGWAQVRYRYAASIAEAAQKLEYDLFYVKNRSFLLDLRILLETVRVVFQGQGAR